MVETAALQVVDGGTRSLGPAGREALADMAKTLRGLPDAQAAAVARLLREFAEDGYLSRLRAFEAPVLKVLAEVINGWDEDGVREFAGAWVSTLVAREDGFDWERGTLEQRQRHRERVAREMARRGL
ncbi:MAG: hypothetical protein GC160_02615 [Acidobacteria bacterium]|nr:hypothetical protein [Acidobacteriota bacterium]